MQFLMCNPSIVTACEARTVEGNLSKSGEKSPMESDNSIKDGQALHVALTAKALAIAIQARAENRVLRQRLIHEGVEIDNKEFNETSKMEMLSLMEELKVKNPDLSSAIPTIQSLIDAGILNFDR